jgi:hypothetical protein
VPDETEDNATMIRSSPHLVSYDDREEARVHAGMAGRVDIGSLHVCGECRWFKAGWSEANESIAASTPSGWAARSATQSEPRSACKMWLTNLGAAPGMTRMPACQRPPRGAAASGKADAS